MYWLIILGLIAVALVIVEKSVHFSHWNSKFWTILVIMFLGFFALTFFGVVKAHNISLDTLNGFLSAVKIYSSWLVHAFGNIKSITGEAIKMDWFPNATA